MDAVAMSIVLVVSTFVGTLLGNLLWDLVIYPKGRRK